MTPTWSIARTMAMFLNVPICSILMGISSIGFTDASFTCRRREEKARKKENPKRDVSAAIRP